MIINELLREIGIKMVTMGLWDVILVRVIRRGLFVYCDLMKLKC